MDEAWEFVKGMGSLVGLATGSFIIWDRFQKAPVAVVVVSPLVPGGAHQAVYLRVKNPSDRPILIKWHRTDRKGVFGIVPDHSIYGIVSAISRLENTVMIDAEGSKDFPLLTPIDVEEIPPDHYIECEVFWSYAQPKIWKRPRRLHVRLPKRSLMIMAPDDYDPKTYDD